MESRVIHRAVREVRCISSSFSTLFSQVHSSCRSPTYMVFNFKAKTTSPTDSDSNFRIPYAHLVPRNPTLFHFVEILAEPPCEYPSLRHPLPHDISTNSTLCEVDHARNWLFQIQRDNVYCYQLVDFSAKARRLARPSLKLTS